jgi:hypothetical protein
MQSSPGWQQTWPKSGSPQSRALGQHVSSELGVPVLDMQSSPGWQQVALVPEPHTCAVGQHVPVTQVAPVWQHWPEQGVVPLGHSHWQVVGLSCLPPLQVPTQLPWQHTWPLPQLVSLQTHLVPLQTGVVPLQVVAQFPQ